MRKLRIGLALLLGTATLAACADFGQQPTPTVKMRNVSIVNMHFPDGSSYFDIKVDQEVTILAPFAGTFHVKYFQNDNGEFFPQIDLAAEDKSHLSLMLGEVGNDVLVLAKDGTVVRKGAPLAKLVGLGPSLALYLPRWNALIQKDGFPQIFGFWTDASGRFIKLKDTTELFDRI